MSLIRIYWPAAVLLILAACLVTTSSGDFGDLYHRCQDGVFGYKCRFHCHCHHSADCDKRSGDCQNGCADRFWGPGCQLSFSCYYNGQKKAYLGTKGITQNGYRCQRWDRQQPQRHSYKSGDFLESRYPDDFCRTTNDAHRPWCYTTNRRKRWDYCNINNCDCPKGRFGKNCQKECHCANYTEACDSILGTCKSGCAVGWRGLGCQTTTSCPRNRWGWDCSLRCHCHNARHCVRLSGPSVECQCESGYFSPPHCEPVTSPRVITFSNRKVNPSQPSQFNCTASAVPILEKSEIHLLGPPDKVIKLLHSGTPAHLSYTRINVFQVDKVYPGENYRCDVRSVAGVTTTILQAQVYELPVLNRKPAIARDGVQSTNISIHWQPWSRLNGDHGDPRIVSYSVWIRAEKKADSDWLMAGIIYHAYCKPICKYLIKKLDPNTMYSIYIITQRVGDGGDGPPGPAVNVKTTCSEPSKPVFVQSVTSKLQSGMVKPRAALTIVWKDPPKITLNCRNIVRYFVYVSKKHKKDSPPKIITVNGGTQPRYTVYDMEPFTEYCVDIRFQTDADFGSEHSNIVCTWTPEAAPGPPQKPVLIRKSSDSIVIRWPPPDRPHGKISRYHIIFWNWSEERKKLSLPPENANKEQKITGLDSYTEYKVQVHAVTAAGVGEGSDILIVRTSIGVPGSVSSLKNTSRNEDEIELSWKPPKQLGQSLLYYTITCRPVNAVAFSQRRQDNKLISTEERVSRNLKTYKVTGLNPATQYVCGINASSSHGTGPKSTILVWTKGADPQVPEVPRIVHATGHTITVDLQSPDDELVSFYRVIMEIVSESDRTKRDVPAALTDVHRDYHRAMRKGDLFYVTAQLQRRDVNAPFVVGDNLTYGGYCNVPLQNQHEYNIWFGAYSSVDGALTNAFSKTEEPVIVHAVASPDKGSKTGVIVGVLLAFLFLLIIIAILIFIWRRRMISRENEKNISTFISVPQPTFLPETENSPPSSPLAMCDHIEEQPLLDRSTSVYGDDGEPIYGNLVQTILPIRVEDLWDYVKQQKENDMDGLRQEYKLIPAGLTANFSVAKKPANKTKNRYVNIIAYDHTRVILKRLDGDPYSDYVNANYIDGYLKSKAYVAAQGPTKATLNDIWRMVWQENSKTVIMLTNPTETGRRKCDQYWPDDGSEMFGDISVQMTACDDLTDFSIRTFLLKKGDECKTVKHFHYTTWPDHGVPRFGNSVILFRQKIRAHDPLDMGPPIIHCSAGVGRTGTYIAIDTQLERARHEGIVDVHNFVQLMRTERVNMVQTIEQYIFVYDVLLEALICGETTLQLQDYCDSYKELWALDPEIGKSKLEEQYEILSLLSSTMDKDEPTTALKAENIFKNRYPDIVPANRCRPYMRTPADDCNDYINAVYINSYTRRHAFLITQMPLPTTVLDFWRLVNDSSVITIVMLNDIESTDETCAQYWSMNTCGESYGPFIVETTTELKTDPNYTMRDFTLTNTNNPDEGARIVRQFHYHRWHDNSDIPSSRLALLEMMRLVDDWQQQSTKKTPVIVHCMNGVNRSGIYCTIHCTLERVRRHQEVDVFQVIKQMRLNRTQLITSLEQYRFCHDIVLDYLDSTEKEKQSSLLQ